MTLDSFFGFGDEKLELSRDIYINKEGTRWENEGEELMLRVSVCGPENYKNFMFLGKDKAIEFFNSLNVDRDIPSNLAGHSVYALYQEGILIGISRRG
jgi:hypothetical protein